MPGQTRPLAERAEFRGFIADLFAAAAGMQSLRKAIARTRGLGGTQLAILLSLSHLARDGPVGIKGLAEHLHVAGPHITAEVTELLRKDLVAKGIDPRDSRAITLSLSKNGAALLNDLSPVLTAVNKELFDMDETDLAQTRIFLRRLIEGSTRSIRQLRNS
jgi:DNA-binding MarR family transcriptional regulator